MKNREKFYSLDQEEFGEAWQRLMKIMWEAGPYPIQASEEQLAKALDA